MGVRSPPLLWLLWLLLLRGSSAAPVQGDAAPPPPCRDPQGWFYNKEAQRCCHQCPKGFTPKTECPTDPQSDCVKQCRRGQFLNYETTRPPRCEDCLSCEPNRNLVPKMPCANNSRGACECRPGLYCQTRMPNTCARCLPLSTCRPGSGVKIRGTSDQDTVCEKCPPGTFSEKDSSIETCKPRALSAKPEVAGEKGSTVQNRLGGGPPRDLTDRQVAAMGTTGCTSVLVGLVITGQPANASSAGGLPDIRMPKTAKEGEKDVTPLVVALLFALLLLAVSVVLWKKRACRKWIIPHRVKMGNQAKMYAIRTLPPAEKGPEETDLVPPESLTESSTESSGTSSSETEETPVLNPEGAELLQVDGGVLVEPAVKSHTSNCIENIYIMRADTVIVGSVSEVPAGKTCPARGEEGSCGPQEGAEESDVDMHYPEQETEFSPGSDVTTPVEEEWEFPSSPLANEKPLESQEGSPGGAS